MNKAKLIVGVMALAMALTVGIAAQTAAPAGQMKSNAKPAQAKAEKAPKAAKEAKPAKAVKTDAEIQACIAGKLAAAPKLKDQGLSASVANGVATFTGMASNGGSKGGVSSIAKSCGAKSVVNNITVKAKEKPVKMAKPEPKKK